MDIRDVRKIVIPRHKILDYLLSPLHPEGSTKAVFFNALGYHQLLWRTLERDIRALVPDKLVEVGHTEFGKKFTALGYIVGPNGRSGRILTVWMIPAAQQDVLQFVTAYPVRKSV